MRDLEHRILSRPVKLNWAGWRSDTATLQRHGWSISAHQDIVRMQIALAFEAPNREAYGVSSYINWEFMEERTDWSLRPVPLGAQLRFGRDVSMHVAELPRFDAIDAEPGMVENRRVNLADFAHFAPAPLVRNNPIVVPEESAAELMDRILEKQQAGRLERIRDELRSEGFEHRVISEHKFHAQIISLAA